MGAKFLAHSSPSLLPSPLSLFPPLPLLPPPSLPPSPTPRLPAVFSCLFASGQMRTWHKLGKCSTAETQPRPSSHLIDIYKVPSTALPFLRVFFPSLCFVLVSFLWLWDSIPKEQLKGERVSFSSRFQGTAQYSRNVKGAGSWRSWLHQIQARKQREADAGTQLPFSTYTRCSQEAGPPTWTALSTSVSASKTYTPESCLQGNSRFCQVHNSQRPSHACSNRSRSKSRNGHLSVFILVVFYSRERSIGAPMSPTAKDLYLNTCHCFAYKIYSL